MLFTKKTTNNKTNTITLKYTDSCTTNSKKNTRLEFWQIGGNKLPNQRCKLKGFRFDSLTSHKIKLKYKPLKLINYEKYKLVCG